jgi:hypothetical protein
MLFFLRFLRFFRFFIFKLAVIHDAAYRRVRIRGDFDQIQFDCRRSSKSLGYVHNAKRFSFTADNPDLRYPDFIVDTGIIVSSRGQSKTIDKYLQFEWCYNVAASGDSS